MEKIIGKAGQDAAKALTDFLNGAGLADRKAFVETIMREHRTLQQESFNIFIDIMKEWSKLDEVQFDARNDFAVRKSKQIIKEIFEAPIDYPVQEMRFSMEKNVEVGMQFVSTPSTFEFTRIDSVRVQEFDGQMNIVVNGRAKKIYE